jgi:hypothetical protein
MLNFKLHAVSENGNLVSATTLIGTLLLALPSIHSIHHQSLIRDKLDRIYPLSSRASRVIKLSCTT